MSYVFERLSLQILNESIDRVELFTPFGMCSMKRIFPNGIYNYYCSAKNISGTTYVHVLSHLEDEKIRTKIQKLLFSKTEDSDLYLDISVEGNTMSIALSKDNISEENGYAAVMCGILIAEMIRSSGKVVRAAFRTWPKDAHELGACFVQSRPNGNSLIRQFIANPDSIKDSGIVKAIERNVNRLSIKNRCRSPLN